MKAVFIVALLCVFLAGCGAIPQQAAPKPSTPIKLSATAVPVATTTTCPAGEFDMLDWATLDRDLASRHHLEGNANPLYTVVWPNKFYWIKSAAGYPWDIQLTDSRNIYLWITEQDWLEPDSYKKSHFNTNMPLTKRCARGGTPGTTVTSSHTSFEIVHGCTKKVVQNLGRMVNQVWGPTKINFGGDIPNNLDTLIVSYRYACNAQYNNCRHREEFYLTKRYGLLKWDHALLKNGKYVQDGMTIYNKIVTGGPPAPYFPCTS